jgi:Fic family protein
MNFKDPLTKERLFSWHAALFPAGYSGLTKIEVGKFRTGPMQVVSGQIGKEKLHYHAPDADRIVNEMDKFFNWWRETEETLDGIVRAGISHFYFVTIHPFDDGNGRLARALTDMALAQDDKLSKRYYSLSNEIISRRKEYYDILESSQKKSRYITDWLMWFIGCFSSALDTSDTLLKDIFAKTEFWRKHRDIEINARQKKVVNKLLDVGIDKFEGGLTTRKYISIAKVSRRTAIREIKDLQKKDILKQNKGEGRSVSYALNW